MGTKKAGQHEEMIRRGAKSAIARSVGWSNISVFLTQCLSTARSI